MGVVSAQKLANATNQSFFIPPGKVVNIHQHRQHCGSRPFSGRTGWCPRTRQGLCGHCRVSFIEDHLRQNGILQPAETEGSQGAPPAADGDLILTQQVQEDKLQGGPAQTLGAASTAEARAQPGCTLGAPFPSVTPPSPVAPPWPSDSELHLLLAVVSPSPSLGHRGELGLHERPFPLHSSLGVLTAACTHGSFLGTPHTEYGALWWSQV